MKFRLLVSVVLPLSIISTMSAYAQQSFRPASPQELCGTPRPTPTERQTIRSLIERVEREAALRTEALVAAVEVPVYVWVIRNGTTASNVPRADIDEMIRNLNQAFSGTRFSFRLAETRQIRNDAWYRMISGSAAERKAKRQLRRGGRESLNIWTAYCGVSEEGNIINGYARWSGSRHGVVIRPNRVRTTTAIHEAAHWFFIWHTFEDGCVSPHGGDDVADTSAQRSSTSGCPNRRDSCRSLAGDDPIHNYMDYSTCRYEFTAGQRRRMDALWNPLRLAPAPQ